MRTDGKTTRPRVELLSVAPAEKDSRERGLLPPERDIKSFKLSFGKAAPPHFRLFWGLQGSLFQPFLLNYFLWIHLRPSLRSLTVIGCSTWHIGPSESLCMHEQESKLLNNLLKRADVSISASLSSSTRYCFVL